MLLLDAGVWVAAGTEADRFHARAREIVLDFDRPVAALDLTLYEIANVVAVKMGKSAGARHLLDLVRTRCGERVQEIDPDLLDLAIELAAEHGLTAYDAAYVAAARARGWTLVSTDLADLVSKGLAVAPDGADYP